MNEILNKESSAEEARDLSVSGFSNSLTNKVGALSKSRDLELS